MALALHMHGKGSGFQKNCLDCIGHVQFTHRLHLAIVPGLELNSGNSNRVGYTGGIGIGSD